MRRVAPCLLLLYALLGTTALGAQGARTPSHYGVGETWTSRDKLYHLGISAAGAGAGYGIARALKMGRWPAVALSAGTTGALGLVRELQDAQRRDKYFSEKDLLWDAAGITIGISLPDHFFFRRRGKEPPS
jgi:uncharacterized protein YfiM (DUF2279 family)